jgi:hypothetical protein
MEDWRSFFFFLSLQRCFRTYCTTQAAQQLLVPDAQILIYFQKISHPEMGDVLYSFSGARKQHGSADACLLSHLQAAAIEVLQKSHDRLF